MSAPGGSSLFDSLARGLSALLSPIVQVVENPALLDRLLAEFGVPPQADNNSLLAALTAVAKLRQRIETMASQSTPSFESIAAVLDAAANAFEALRQLQHDGVLSELEDLGSDLVNLLVIGSLEYVCPAARPAAALLTLIDPAEEQQARPPVIKNGRLIRDTHRLDRVRFDRLPKLLRDPAGTLQAEYGNSLLTSADAHAMADKLFPRLLRLLTALGIHCRYGFDPLDADFLGDAGPLVAHSLIIYADDALDGAVTEAGVVLSLSAADQGDLGLVISPFGAISAQRSVGPWSVAFDLTAGIDVVAWGRHGVTLIASPGVVEAHGKVSAALVSLDDQPAYVLGDPAGTRLEVAGVRFGLEAALSQAKQTFGLSADVSGASLVITGGDGFLSDILPAGGARAKMDLGIAWSSDKGLTLHRGAGLEVTIPVGFSFAGVTLSAIHLALNGRDEDVAIEASASLSAMIGPVTAVVDRIGIGGAVTFPDGGGNLGVAHLDLGFKFPNGIGLRVEAGGVVSGGGFLFRDAGEGVYAGVLQLSLHELMTLTAFGLIATRLPDGSAGYSLIIFITAEDFRPLPLGLGFTLQGVGGMVAVHRTFDEEVLRSGLKNDTLGTLLFPRNAVANAPAIIRGLSSAFPARRGSYLLGVLARIGWATPTLVLFDLALIFEFGARKRLLVLGRISALLPSAENDLIRLKLDALGVIDFDQGTASIDAVLVDSKLVHKFPLTGAMALRARWTSGPGFVLAVGGFNPRFAPPAGMPKLERIAIALSSGNNPRITCEAYFAITSNTVQFGARAQLHAAAYGFSVDGDIGYDVLVQLIPLHFIADFQASVQLKRGSSNLFKVSLKGELEGPRPLRVSGKASFEILWCDFTVRFDKTLIEGEKPPLPPAVDVLAELKKALASPQSWSTLGPVQGTHGVALRKLSGPGIVLDPLGRLQVKQQVVPLNTGRDIDTFGGAPVRGAKRFGVGAALEAESEPTTPLRDQFAPAQYFAMSDDEKLAGPSFEEMEAGLVFGSDALSFAATELVAAPMAYESIVIDRLQAPAQPEGAHYRLSVGQLLRHTASGAAARAPARSAGPARFRDATPVAAASMRKPNWRIMPLGDGAAAAVPAKVETWSEYRAQLATMNRGGAAWQMVPLHELAA